MLRILLSVLILIFSSSIYSQNIDAVENLYKKGMQHFQKGNYEESVAAFTRAIELTSTLGSNTKEMRNSFSGDAEKLDAALADRVTVIDPRTGVLYRDRGNVYFSMGDLDKAITDYGRAIALSPGMAEAYHCRGTAWLTKKDYERAMADYDKALKIDPQYTRSYLGRGLAELDMDKVKEAFNDFDHAVKTDPKCIEAYSYRGDALRQIGDYTKSLADFEYAMKLDPNFANSWLGRGTLRMMLRDYDGAMKDLTRAIELDRRLSQAYANRGYILLVHLGKEAEAEKDFERALAGAPWMRPEIEANIEKIKNARKN